MAKLKREVIGSFLKAKDDGKAPYIKFKNAATFKQGDMVRVENKKFQLSSLENAISEGKLTGEIAEDRKSVV